jgi:hypothetical protein
LCVDWEYGHHEARFVSGDDLGVTKVAGAKPRGAMFKIEVFNALQMRFGPSKYTSLKIALQNATPN